VGKGSVPAQFRKAASSRWRHFVIRLTSSYFALTGRHCHPLYSKLKFSQVQNCACCVAQTL